jgi:hypothetical protein
MRRFTAVETRRALVFALVLVMSSCVIHGARTTPSKLIIALCAWTRTTRLIVYFFENLLHLQAHDMA